MVKCTQQYSCVKVLQDPMTKMAKVPPPPLPRLFKGFNLLLLSNTSESWDNGPLKSNTNTENSKRTGPGDVTDQQLSYYRACLVKMKSIEMVVGDHYL